MDLKTRSECQTGWVVNMDHVKQALDRISTYSWDAAINCCAGFLFGVLNDTDSVMAAQIAMIHGLAVDLFADLSSLATRGGEKKPNHYHATMLIGNILIDLSAILSLRQLQIIGNRGTVIFTSLSMLRCSQYLKQLIPSSLSLGH